MDRSNKMRRFRTLAAGITVAALSATFFGPVHAAAPSAAAALGLQPVQPAVKFDEYSGGAIRAAVVMAGRTYDSSALVRVASIQTVQAREIQIEPNAVCFVDEAHIALIDDVIAAHPTVTWIGLTGTPIRENGRPMRGAWQTMVIGPTPSRLIALVPRKTSGSWQDLRQGWL
jgi:hypothetical protein